MFGPGANGAIVLTFSRNCFRKPAAKLRHVSVGVTPLFRRTSMLVYAHNVLHDMIPPTAGGPIMLQTSNTGSVLTRLDGRTITLSVSSTIHLGDYTITTRICVNDRCRRRSVGGVVRLISTKVGIKVPAVTIANINGSVIHSRHCFSLTAQVTTRVKTRVVGACCIRGNFRQVITKYPMPVIVTNNGGLPRHRTLRVY